MLSFGLHVLLIFCLAEAAENHKPGLCNTNRACSDGPISEALCHERGCCFLESAIHLHNCFQKVLKEHHPLPDQGRNIVEIPPPDDPRLSYLTKMEAEKLRNNGQYKLTTAQAIHIANLIENELKHHASQGSELNWNMEESGIFQARIKRNPSTFVAPVKFSTGTTVQVAITLQELARKSITAVIFIEYFTLANILQGHGNNRQECTAHNVVSVTAFDEQWNDVSIPVTYSFHGLNATDSFSSYAQNRLTCEFLNESLQHWSPGGCKVINSTKGEVTCFCNHTTKFSILFAVVETQLDIPESHVRNIVILEYAMEATSFFCLVLTLLSMLLVLQRRSKSVSSNSDHAKQRTIVHINFVTALGVLHLIRLLSDAAYKTKATCAITVFASHYFMLASGMWMLLEGFVLYLTLILKSLKFTKLGWIKYAAGWGVPGVIVLVAAAIGLTGGTYVQKIKEQQECSLHLQDAGNKQMPTESSYQYCWLSITSGMIWSATGPLLAIFVINMFILAHTVYFILQMSLKTDSMMPSTQKHQSSRHLWNTTKGIIILFPILGVPWLIGFLVNIQEHKTNIAFRYIHVTLNGLQGVFVFILYSAVNTEVRKIAYRVLNNKWQQHKISTSLSRTQSARERLKRSVSSLMGQSTPLNRKRSYNPQLAGSSYSQQSHYTQRRQSSGSSSINSMFKMRSSLQRVGSNYSQQSNFTQHQQRPRSSSFNSTLIGNVTRKPSTCSTGLTSQQGNTGSLPRGLGYRGMPQLTRTPSTRSLHSENGSKKTCVVCGTFQNTCRHANRSMTHLNLEAKDVILSHYEFQQGSAKELPTLHSRWRRMTAEEFKRFSAIPEEKRRSGVNSFYIEDTKTIAQQAWNGKAKTLERTNVSESHKMQTYTIHANIHTSPTSKKDKNEEKFLLKARPPPIQNETINMDLQILEYPSNSKHVPHEKRLKSALNLKQKNTKPNEKISRLSIATPNESNGSAKLI